MQTYNLTKRAKEIIFENQRMVGMITPRLEAMSDEEFINYVIDLMPSEKPKAIEKTYRIGNVPIKDALIGILIVVAAMLIALPLVL